MAFNFKDKIICKMSPIDFGSGAYWPTERDWDNYFNREYSGNVQFINISGDFISYEDRGSEVFIKDFVSDNIKNSIRLWYQLEDVADGRTIKGKIHTANYKLLNTAIRVGFKIVSFDGLQYLVERK